MNKKAFFASIRATLFGGKLSTSQVEGINVILNEYNTPYLNKDGKPVFLNDLRKLAYILATAFHETAYTMQPIAEYGKGKGRVYGNRIKMNRQPYSDTDAIFYGRGYVQLTWYENYFAAGKILGLDLIQNPDLMLIAENSVKILFYGMRTGMFTGASLSRFITDEMTDFKGCRKIINGTDKDVVIAGHAQKFYTALTLLN